MQPKVKAVNAFTFEEAARIEQEVHAQDEQRRQDAEERKRRKGLPIKGEILTEKERAARIWAFMYVSIEVLTLFPNRAVTLSGTTSRQSPTWKMKKIQTRMIPPVGLTMIKTTGGKDKT